MRPAPPAAGFQLCRPGRIARAGNLDCAANPSRDVLSAMPLTVTQVTNSRREGRMRPPLGDALVRACSRGCYRGERQHPPTWRTDSIATNQATGSVYIL